MAAKLQCEICGGKLIGKPGGIFECDSCGVEYSTEWAKMKIQEIRGTVTVEGTVEVTGKVQVDGPVKVDSSANIEALLKRGNIALEDGEFKKAIDFFNNALNIDAMCAEAYLGLAMSEERCKNRDEFHDAYLRLTSDCKNNKHLVRAKQYSDGMLKDWLDMLDVEAGRIEKNAVERVRAFREKIVCCQHIISAYGDHVVGVRTDGTVVTAGHCYNGADETADWTDITAIVTGGTHTVGLRKDGSVIATKFKPIGTIDSYYGQCEVSDWTDIVAVAAGYEHTVGLKRNGTVVAVGRNDNHQCEVSDWKDIVSITAVGESTFGLKANGTVVKTPRTYGDPRRNVFAWTDIVALTADGNTALGLKMDGTLLPRGNYDPGHPEREWTDIAAIDAGYGNFVGLKTDGTVSAVLWGMFPAEERKSVCNVSEWKNIVAVTAGSHYTVGLKADGTVLFAGKNENLRREVSNWKLFKSYKTIELERSEEMKKRSEEMKRVIEERMAIQKRAEEERNTLSNEKTNLLAELSNLRGLFTGKRRREIETRLAEINAELKKLQ